MTQLSHPVEVRIRGRWITIPALEVNGKEVVSTGNWLRIAKVRGEEMMEEELGDPGAYCAALQKANRKTLGADIFTFTQKPTSTEPKYSYPIQWESVAAVRLAGFEGWWEALPQVTRKNVRRSQKRGVSVRVNEFDRDLIEGIRSVNDDTPVRQGMRNAHFGQSYEETEKRYGEFAGRCDFICAYFQEEIIGFLHLVYRQNTAAILNLTVKPSHSDKRPANALVAKAVELCAARGISLLTYGLYNHGNKRESSLREFKDRNGFTEILVPRYFVPLNPRGRICMKLKLHRGVVGILPHSIITVGVAARAFWYKTWFSIRRCSSMLERPNSNRQMERSIPPAGSTH
jgi:GNAT superfamily N-acetyltransferase